MGRFKVTWTRDAETALAEVWMTADASAVAQAQDLIDRRLAADPFGHGEEVSERLYRIVVTPLVAYFEIDVTANLVTVTSAGRVTGAR